MNSKIEFSEVAWMPVMSAIVLSMVLIAACARRESASLVSQAQRTAPAAPATIELNAEDIGTSSDTSLLSKKLSDVFEMRKEQHAFKRGFEGREDLRLYERIEKTVFVKAERSIRLEEFAKIIEAVEDAGAAPVLLPIHEGWDKVDWRGMRLGKLNPLTLLVRLRQPDSPAPMDKPGVRSLRDLEIASGIPITISSASGESVAVITIGKNGEFILDGKHIEKAALENEIRDRIKAKPATEKVVSIKCAPDVSYGSLEDIYYAAFAAGSERILLDTGEQTITWEEQGMKFKLPAGWRKVRLGSSETFWHLDGPDGARLSIGVLDQRNVVDVEQGLKKEYEFLLERQQKGEIDEVRYLELDGLKGVLVRAAYEGSTGLSWKAFRMIQGKQQFISLGLHIPVDKFNRRRDELYAILNSAKLTKD